MPFNPAIPVQDSPLNSAEMRAQFVALKELIDTSPFTRATASNVDGKQLQTVLVYTVPVGRHASINMIATRALSIVGSVAAPALKVVTTKGEFGLNHPPTLVTGKSFITPMIQSAPWLTAGDTVSVEVTVAANATEYLFSLDLFIALLGENE